MEKSGAHMRRKMVDIATAYRSHDSMGNAVRLMDMLDIPKRRSLKKLREKCSHEEKM